jgi:dTDP-4-dehydrorhamnose 3,5-epimerase
VIFTPAPLAGSYLISLEKHEDHRGFFARTYCQKEFAAKGLEPSFVQMNTSFSRSRATLRGLHYQLAPAAEVKLVRCIAGTVYDVILDLRIASATFAFGKHFGVELSAPNRTMIYVPQGFAHGFITLTDDTEVLYLVSTFYSPKHERGLRYNDRKFNIRWPTEPAVISSKDAAYPDFDPIYHLGEPQ